MKKIQNRREKMGTAASDKDLERASRLNSEVRLHKSFSHEKKQLLIDRA